METTSFHSPASKCFAFFQSLPKGSGCIRDTCLGPVEVKRAVITSALAFVSSLVPQTFCILISWLFGAEIPHELSLLIKEPSAEAIWWKSLTATQQPDGERRNDSILKTNSHFISRSRSLLPGDVKVQEEPHHNIAVLKVWLQGGRWLSLHKEPHGEDKGQWVRVVPEVSFQHKKEFCCSDNNRSLEQPPQRHGRVPIAGGFQDAIGQVARSSHLGFPSHDRLDQMIF